MNKPALGGGLVVAGAAGMVGASICRACVKHEIPYKPVTRANLDLTDTAQVNDFFDKTRPKQLIIAAAKVGGIQANDLFPADFITQNIAIQQNLMIAALNCSVEKVVFLGSSCIYPKMADQPIKESSLLSGPLEPTNEAYAIAKIAGIKTCESINRQHDADYRSLMPTNLYGPGDNFHETNSHVIPAIMRRIHEAKSTSADNVKIWGTGKPKREFLHVDDLADAVLHFLSLSREDFWREIPQRESHINIGTGQDVSIKQLALLISKVVGYQGNLVFDSTKPDGTPRKLLDVSRASQLGWSYRINLEAGLAETYKWFLANHATIRT
jgi:GDP-L-fucose synthase